VHRGILPNNYRQGESHDRRKKDVGVEKKGRFFKNITLSNKSIREARASQIDRAVGLKYKRMVEDLETKKEDLMADRENATDLSPSIATSLVPAQDLDADKFVANDLQLTIKLRNIQIQLDAAKERYEYFFGVEQEEV